MKVRTCEGTFDVEKISMEGAKPYTAWEDPTKILEAKRAILEAINLVAEVGEGELAEYLEAILPICEGNVPLDWDLTPLSMAEEIAEEEYEFELASRLSSANWALQQELSQADFLLN